MFTKKSPVDSNLQTQIDAVLSRMNSYDAEDAEYDKLINQLERLYKLQNNHPVGFKPSADAILAVAGNLVGLLVIVNHERLHVVTSKALSFVMKTKL